MKKVLLFVAALFCCSFVAQAATVQVAAGEKALLAAVTAASAGDVLELGTGTFTEWDSFILDKQLTIKAAEGASPIVKIYNIKIQAPLELDGLQIENLSPDNYLLRVYENVAGTVAFKNCHFTNQAPTAFLVIKESKTLDNLLIDNCVFDGAKKTDDLGGFIYAPAGIVSNFTLTNSTFMNNDKQDCGIWMQHVANAYVDHCTFYNCGTRVLYLTESTPAPYLVQNCIVYNPTATSNYCVAVYAGDVKNVMYYNTNAPRSGSTNTNCINADPKFKDAANADFTLTEGSPALTAGTDGKAIGDPRWIPETAPVYALNPYAYRVSAVAGNPGEVTVTYSLNVDAAEVYAQLFRDETMVTELPLTGTAKGTYTQTLDFSAAGLSDGVYTAKIAVIGVAHEFTTYADSTVTFNNRYHATVDANPLSPNFGNIYGACRYDKVGIYRIAPDYSYLNTTPDMIGQASWASVQRGAVAPNGEMWFSTWGDANSGIYRYNPAVDANASTQFFIGTRASSGLITNNGEEVGCSTPGIAIYSAGKDSKLYLIGEDFSAGNTKGSLAIYNIGNEDGSIVTSWDKAPTAHYNTLTDRDGTNFAMAATPYGVWICQNRAKAANIAGARSLQFIGNDGVQRFLSLDDALFNGSYGAGVVTNAAYDKLWMVNGDGDIQQFSVAWSEGSDPTPSLTLDATYATPFGAISQMTFDYAGNIVAVGGTGATPYSNNASVLRLAVFSLPATTAPEVATPVVGFQYVVGAVTDLYETAAQSEVRKVIRDGQLYIIRDGVTYNIQGQIVR